MDKALSHNQLAEDLARHLAGYSVPMAIWTDMQLGPSGSARPDVYAIEKTYTALRARVFEVKVSRADFLSDVTSGKYLRYAKFAGCITFATPAGLVGKDEIPKGCGLITRSADGMWRYQRKPVIQPTPDLPRDAWLKLVIDGCAREREAARVTKTNPKAHMEWAHQRRARAKAGEELGLALANRGQALAKLKEEIEGAQNLRIRHQEERLAAARKDEAQLEEVRAKACAALSLPDGDWCAIRSELDARLAGDGLGRVRSAMETMDHFMKNLESSREKLSRLLPVNDEQALQETGHG